MLREGRSPEIEPIIAAWRRYSAAELAERIVASESSVNHEHVFRNLSRLNPEQLAAFGQAFERTPLREMYEFLADHGLTPGSGGII